MLGLMLSFVNHQHIFSANFLLDSLIWECHIKLFLTIFSWIFKIKISLKLEHFSFCPTINIHLENSSGNVFSVSSFRFRSLTVYYLYRSNNFKFCSPRSSGNYNCFFGPLSWHLSSKLEFLNIWIFLWTVISNLF